MTIALPSLTVLTDEQLLARIKTLAHEERHASAALIAALVELDERRLYLGQGYSSLFAYCTQVLHLSEDAAYNRIRAARVAARWPIVIEMIAAGSVTVTAVRLLSDSLTDSNHLELLGAARHKSKRDVEELIAAVRPQPAISPNIRKVPTFGPSLSAATTISPPLLRPTPDNARDDGGGEASPRPAPVAKPASVTPLA